MRALVRRRIVLAQIRQRGGPEARIARAFPSFKIPPEDMKSQDVALLRRHLRTTEGASAAPSVSKTGYRRLCPISSQT